MTPAAPTLSPPNSNAGNAPTDPSGPRSVPAIVTELVATEAFQRLATKDQDYLKRMLTTDASVYARRLKALGLEGLESVLDAGCGFGQWTACLAETNASVTAIDCASDRLDVAAELHRLRGVTNVKRVAASVTALPFPDGSFDGIFSYSVIYLTDWRRAVAELSRCLRANGLLYINTNGLGWYLYNLLEDHNSGVGWSSRQMAIDTFENTLRYYSRGEWTDGRCLVTPSALVCEELQKYGLEVVARGPDGSINVTQAPTPKSFYAAEKHGHESVFEVLCRKR